MRFWDSSAVFPLVADDAHSAAAAETYDDDPRMAVWCLTPVEVWSALARRRREGLARSPDMRFAKAKLAAFARSWIEISALSDVAVVARRLLETHPLRAADALQLAAALYAVDDRPDGVEFVTFDRRLATAAEKEGFRAVGAAPDDR